MCQEQWLKIKYIFLIINHNIIASVWNTIALACVAQLVGAPSSAPKGRQFDSQSGYSPRLQVWSQLVREQTGSVPCRGVYTRQPIGVFLSHLSLSFSLSPLLPLFLKINGHMPQWGLKIKKEIQLIVVCRSSYLQTCWTYLLVLMFGLSVFAFCGFLGFPICKIILSANWDIFTSFLLLFK